MSRAQATHKPGVPLLAGVDGCRAGWVVVVARLDAQDAQAHQVRLCARFADVLSLEPAPAVVAVDMPIGLLDTSQPGGRDCDRLARRLLGRRASSVFTPPPRPLLDATHYAHVRGQGLSIQAFNILPKMREVKIPAASCGAFRDFYQTNSAARSGGFSGTGYTDE